MEILNIEEGPKSPGIKFDTTAGIIELKGRSIPENSHLFYLPLLELVKKYASSPQKETLVNVHLEYFNTSSSKCILDIFKRLEKIHKAGESVISINWFYEKEDEDMLTAGKDYQSMITSVPFKMIEITE
jgi:hypothetical protein